MLKKFVYVVIAVLLFQQIGQAQSKGVKKVWGFSKGILYGKELRGLDGKTISRNDTVYFFYIEVKGNEQPQISTVSYKKNFSPAIYPVEENEVAVGRSHATGKPILIKKSVGNSLWRVELSPPDDKIKHLPVSNKMIIKGKANGRPFSFSISKPVLLESDSMG